MSILIISNKYPPSRNSGVRRIESLLESFRALTQDFYLLTTKMNNRKFEPRVIEAIQLLLDNENRPRINADNLPNTNYVPFPDKSTLFWTPFAFLKIVNKEFRIIYASLPSLSCLLISYLYKLIHRKVYLIVEYRDFIGLNPEFYNNRKKGLCKTLELHMLNKCNLVLTTTQGMSNVLKKHKIRPQVKVLRNYISKKDFLEANSLPKIMLNNSFYNIGYIGKLHNGRNPEDMLGMTNLKINNKPVCFHYIGLDSSESKYVKKVMMQLNINIDRVIFHGIVNRIESLVYMKSMDGVFLSINANAKIEEGYGIPGKLYDYAALNGNLFADECTIKNIETDIDITINNTYNQFFHFKLNNNPFLEDELSALLLDIIKNNHQDNTSY